MPKVIKRLWRGEVRLVMTYWVYGLIGFFVYSVVAGALIGFLFLWSDISNETLANLAPFSIIPYDVFFFFAIWRSASNYEGPVIWSVLAKASVVIGIIVTIGELILATTALVG